MPVMDGSVRQQKSVINNFQTENQNHQYSNLNLNQRHQCLNSSSVQSYSNFLSNKKHFDSKNPENHKRNYSSLNKSTLIGSSKTFKHFNPFNVAEEEESEKRSLKNVKNSTSNATKPINNSTLSLHIAAYENSIIEDTVTDNLFDGNEKSTYLHKKYKNAKQKLSNSILIFQNQNQFEFPRQQGDDGGNEPEVMQFKSSQKLADPKQSGSSKKAAVEEKKEKTRKAMADYFIGEIEEIPANVCGQIADRYIIEAPIDDMVKRDFSMYHVYDCNQPELNLFLVIPRHDVKQNRRNTTVHRMLRVLHITRNRSVHFPRLVLSGRLSKLVFGLDGEQAFERDPEWPDRPMAIIESDNTILGSLPCFSNNGALPVETSLQLAIGTFRALAALHRAGFVHRLVSPYSFTVPTPLSPVIIQRGVTIIDFSFVIPFPIKPRVHVPFVGTMRYSSIRAHFGREQGPSDDVISLIYMTAEFINGRLPWRSVRDEQTIVLLKRDFCQTDCFRRLPHEIRRLYREMYLTPGPAAIDHRAILAAFTSALSRKNPDLQKKLPAFLNTETPKIFPRQRRDRRMKKVFETGSGFLKSDKAGGDAGGGGGTGEGGSGGGAKSGNEKGDAKSGGAAGVGGGSGGAKSGAGGGDAKSGGAGGAKSGGAKSGGAGAIKSGDRKSDAKSGARIGDGKGVEVKSGTPGIKADGAGDGAKSGGDGAKSGGAGAGVKSGGAGAKSVGGGAGDEKGGDAKS